MPLILLHRTDKVDDPKKTDEKPVQDTVAEATVKTQEGASFGFLTLTEKDSRICEFYFSGNEWNQLWLLSSMRIQK